MKLLALLALVCAPALAQVANPDVTQENIGSTICVRGWTKTVRPPVSYTNALKRKLMAEQGIAPERIREFELDHWIPIELGGHPRDPVNLRLQPWAGPDGAHAKDVVETAMKRAVCAGNVPLDVARECMAKDWKSCGQTPNYAASPGSPA